MNDQEEFFRNILGNFIFSQVQQQGNLVAVGDSDGVITLCQLCDGLAQAQPNEKNIVGIY